MNHVVKHNGFTLIELMLAMSFVSMLLIAIAMTVIQIGDIYNKGLTLKDVNQAGRSVASELQRSISQSAPFNINPGGNRYIAQDWGGRLCIGQYSYIWNYGFAIQDDDNARLNIYSNSNDKISFVKVTDPSASYCINPSEEIDFNNSTELLNVGEHDLAIHDFTISTEASAGDSKTKQQLYSLEFLIGTNDKNALTTDSSTGLVICKAPNQAGADPAYCSINRFDIVALAGNTVQ
jgi:Tfp pilus assembly protein FimT